MTKRKPAIFLDRDGVINHDQGYLYRLEDFIWIAGAIATIRYFNTAGYWTFVVTNQSGVARGYYQESDVRQLHLWINQQLAKEEAQIDAFYYCPHYPGAPLTAYNYVCNCRKPKPGMIQQAFAEWPVAVEQSFLVGDKQSDIECAHNAGIPGYLFTGGNLFEFLRQIGKVTMEQ
jgi:D-glycero-D-manno-heptose 1,7-bisphosphate phosphatase